MIRNGFSTYKDTLITYNINLQYQLHWNSNGLFEVLMTSLLQKIYIYIPKMCLDEIWTVAP